MCSLLDLVLGTVYKPSLSPVLPGVGISSSLVRDKIRMKNFKNILFRGKPKGSPMSGTKEGVIKQIFC